MSDASFPVVVFDLDSTLLDNPGYLQTYPALANFLAQHPEIRHNPQYYFASYGDDPYRRGGLTPIDGGAIANPRGDVRRRQPRRAS